MARRYKTVALAFAYQACRERAADPTSAFWYDGKPYRGAGHRAAYWDGRSGVRHTKNSGKTIQDAAYRAGQDDAKVRGAAKYETRMVAGGPITRRVGP